MKASHVIPSCFGLYIEKNTPVTLYFAVLCDMFTE